MTPLVNEEDLPRLAKINPEAAKSAQGYLDLIDACKRLRDECITSRQVFYTKEAATAAQDIDRILKEMGVE